MPNQCLTFYLTKLCDKVNSHIAVCLMEILLIFELEIATVFPLDTPFSDVLELPKAKLLFFPELFYLELPLSINLIIPNL